MKKAKTAKNLLLITDCKRDNKGEIASINGTIIEFHNTQQNTPYYDAHFDIKNGYFSINSDGHGRYQGNVNDKANDILPQTIAAKQLSSLAIRVSNMGQTNLTTADELEEITEVLKPFTQAAENANQDNQPRQTAFLALQKQSLQAR